MNPIIQRELSLLSRLAMTFRLRVWVVGGGILLYFLFALGSGSWGTTSPGFASAVYDALMLTALGFVLVSGAFTTADCLSSERRAGTLGLVFLTRMRPTQVLWGKLVSLTLPSLYSLVALIPVLALPVLSGGVTVIDLTKLVLALVVCLFLSSCVGLLVSSIWRGSTETWVITIVVMLGSLLVIPLIAQVSMMLAPQFPVMAIVRDAFKEFGPLELVQHSRSVAFRFVFWSSLLAHLAIAVGCFFMAVFRVRRCLMRSTESDNEETPVGAPEVSKATDSPSPVRWVGRKGARLPLLDGQQPLNWLAARNARFSAFAGTIICLSAVIFIGLLLQTRSPDIIEVTLMLPLLHIFLKGVIAMEACQVLHRQRGSGMLELLSVSPVPVENWAEVIRDCLEWKARFFIRVVAGTTLITACYLLFSPSISLGGGSQVMLAMVVFVGTALLYYDIEAVFELGILSGLTQPTERRALLHVLRRIILVPWLWVLLVFIGMMLVGMRDGEMLIAGVLMWQFAYCCKSHDTARNSRQECQSLLRSRGETAGS